MSITFNDRVAIVTGAGGGLGRCHALDLAKTNAWHLPNPPPAPVTIATRSLKVIDILSPLYKVRRTYYRNLLSL